MLKISVIFRPGLNVNIYEQLENAISTYGENKVFVANVGTHSIDLVVDTLNGRDAVEEFGTVMNSFVNKTETKLIRQGGFSDGSGKVIMLALNRGVFVNADVSKRVTNLFNG